MVSGTNGKGMGEDAKQALGIGCTQKFQVGGDGVVMNVIERGKSILDMKNTISTKATVGFCDTHLHGIASGMSIISHSYHSHPIQKSHANAQNHISIHHFSLTNIRSIQQHG
jgi:predicted amidohydrolase YtcJ